MKRAITRLLSGGVAVFLVLGCSQAGRKTLDLKSEEDLHGLTVSMTAGGYYDNKYSQWDDVTVFRVNYETDGFNAVRQGLSDVHVGDELIITPEAKERLNIRMAFRGEEFFDVAYALRKGNDALKEELDSFISACNADGTLDAIISHWANGTPAPPMPQAAAISRPEPIRCVTALVVEPICYVGEGGQWMGMDADILQRFALWSGRPFQMQFQEFGSAIIALDTGQCDIVSACLYVTDERKKSVDFSIPYYQCHAGYFVYDGAKTARMGFGERLKRNLLTEGRWKLLVDGLLETLKITVFAILLGTLLGVGICAMLRSRRKWVRRAATLYGAFIQGIPTLVLLLIMFYVVLAGSGLSGRVVAIFTFALCFAWSSGSIFDAAISSVPKGQTEAGLSLGFTPLQTFIGIVFPQAVKTGMPLYSGECVSLLKATSIVGYIAIQDLTRASDIIRSRTFDAFIPLLIITVLYFVLAWCIRALLNLFLKKK